MHGLDLRALLSVFGVIFVAELPDKTALATLVLATRHSAWPVLLGTTAALLVQSIIAVAAGELVSLLPARPVHIGTGIVFIVSALVMWRKKEEHDEGNKDDKLPLTFWRVCATTFAVVFIAEWGDLTQIGTAALAARYKQPLMVLIGATAALWSVAAIAVFVGNRAAKILDPRRTQRIAAVVFALVGVALIAGWL